MAKFGIVELDKVDGSAESERKAGGSASALCKFCLVSGANNRVENLHPPHYRIKSSRLWRTSSCSIHTQESMPRCRREEIICSSHHSLSTRGPVSLTRLFRNSRRIHAEAMAMHRSCLCAHRSITNRQFRSGRRSNCRPTLAGARPEPFR
jgi:hypothetical protein